MLIHINLFFHKYREKGQQENNSVLAKLNIITMKMHLSYAKKLSYIEISSSFPLDLYSYLGYKEPNENIGRKPFMRYPS